MSPFHSTHMSASIVRSLCVFYPQLADVWKNHLLLFVLPNALTMRKHLSIAQMEMKRRIDSATRQWLKRCSLLFRHKYRYFWVNDHVVVLVEPLYSISYHHTVHLSDNGLVHCSTCTMDSIREYSRSTFWIEFHEILFNFVTQANTVEDAVYVRREDTREWIITDRHFNKENDNVCVRRALMLCPIRNR
jgi:hypothetical protein